jgi:hypothetical protein
MIAYLLLKELPLGEGLCHSGRSVIHRGLMIAYLLLKEFLLAEVYEGLLAVKE